MSKNKLTKSKFRILTIDRVFEGYHYGNKWNGFACPYFTKKVSKEIVEEYNKLDNCNAYWDPKEKVFKFFDESYDDLVYKPHQIEEITLYDIGSHCWTWKEVN